MMKILRQCPSANTIYETLRRHETFSNALSSHLALIEVKQTRGKRLILEILSSSISSLIFF
jgi:hypothetical protein